MNVQISVRHMATSHVINQMITDLSYEVKTKHENIQNIDVKIDDINGPYKAGVDKRCHLKVRGRNHLSIDINDIDEDITSAIERAFQHLTRSLNTHSSSRKKLFEKDDIPHHFSINAAGDCHE